MTEIIKAEFTRPLANPNSDREFAGLYCIHVDFSEDRKHGSTAQDIYRVTHFLANGNDYQEDFHTAAEANTLVKWLLDSLPDLKLVINGDIF